MEDEPFGGSFVSRLGLVVLCYWSDPPMSGQLVMPMPEHFRGQTAHASIRFNGSPVKVVI